MKTPRPAVLLLSLLTAAASAEESGKGLTHGRAIKGDTSAPMRELVGRPVPTLPAGFQVEVPLGRPPVPPLPAAPPIEAGGTAGAAQTSPGSRLTPTVGLSVEGLSEIDNTDTVGFVVVPPDTNGDIGFDHLGNKIYIQTVNVVWAIFDAETGSRIAGPTALNSFWVGFGGDCETETDGDPIVLYDDYAGRWVFAQFVLDKGLICVAVSADSDPLGSYHRYAFQIATVDGTADYPKLGVWPQAPDPGGTNLTNQSSYTLTTRNFPIFDNAFTHSVLLERDKMLAGDPAPQVVSLAHTCAIFPTECLEGQLPPHYAGPPPPFGHCPVFVAIRDNPYDDTTVSSDGVRLDKICVKWDNVENSSFSDTFIQSAPPYSRQLGDGYGACISQRPAPGEALDCLSRFTMYRAQFRYFDGSDGNGEHVSVVFNSTVRFVPEPPDPTVAGILWMEMRSPNGIGQWTIHQRGTYSPDDSRERWMGSIAQNGERAIALGYSRMSATEPPSIYYTTRFFGDPAGEMGTEEVCHDGTGVQTASSNRWGDYSSMSVDPEDDCTFWYTQEYYETTGSFDFKTRICSFYGCNFEPSVSIDMPGDGSVFDDQTLIDFAGTASDNEDGDLTSGLAWTSSLDGAIGSAGAFSVQLSAGPHTIETSVTDSGGKSATDEIQLTVTSASCPAHLDVEAGMVVGLDMRTAVNTIDVLAGVSVESGGDLQLTAGDRITFENGVTVHSGGALSAATSADPCGTP